MLLVIVFLLVMRTMESTSGLHFDLMRKQSTERGRRLFYEGAGTSKEADGVYYATIRIGTPNPQDFTVIIDTGSATIAVPCKGCSCGNHNHFDASLSSSNTDTGNTYSQCYAEGSCNRGHLLNDMMCLGEECTEDEMITHDFGCCTTFASSFKEQSADGIVGMGGVSNSFIAALRSKHDLLDENEFSLCLGSNAGHLNIGGYDNSLNLEPVQWIEHTSLSGYYHLAFENVVLDVGSNGSSRIVNINKNALIDSGTSFTYVPHSIHNSIKSQFNAWCAESESRCVGTHNPSDALDIDIRDAIACYSPPRGYSKSDLAWYDTFPSLEFKIKNHDAYVCVPPEQYFFSSAGNAMCVGLFKDSQFVVGANFMVDFQYIYDSDHSRIGIARAKCDGRPRCCGHCIERSTPIGPFEWCTSDWNPKTCSETCDERPYVVCPRARIISLEYYVQHCITSNHISRSNVTKSLEQQVHVDT